MLDTSEFSGGDFRERRDITSRIDITDTFHSEILINFYSAILSCGDTGSFKEFGSRTDSDGHNDCISLDDMLAAILRFDEKRIVFDLDDLTLRVEFRAVLLVELKKRTLNQRS
jgi:hypothetical protein